MRSESKPLGSNDKAFDRQSALIWLREACKKWSMLSEDAVPKMINILWIYQWVRISVKIRRKFFLHSATRPKLISLLAEIITSISNAWAWSGLIHKVIGYAEYQSTNQSTTQSTTQTRTTSTTDPKTNTYDLWNDWFLDIRVLPLLFLCTLRWIFLWWVKWWPSLWRLHLQIHNADCVWSRFCRYIRA